MRINEPYRRPSIRVAVERGREDRSVAIVNRGRSHESVGQDELANT
jgi:hypothetical protein